MTQEELRQILSGGKDCGKIQLYRKAYQDYTGKEYPNACTSCACNYLYRYLLNFLK